jgi:hypothetical protein
MIFTAAELGDYIEAEFQKWVRVVQVANIKVQ